ncbi:MAG: hypothetical protein J3K34DRAFT_491743 [Monoraphidium minutum]|nr:MAG: hypothetical protein J3K34DRAFT_491743 [Monoraphidium minutum]
MGAVVSLGICVLLSSNGTHPVITRIDSPPNPLLDDRQSYSFDLFEGPGCTDAGLTDYKHEATGGGIEVVELKSCRQYCWDDPSCVRYAILRRPCRDGNLMDYSDPDDCCAGVAGNLVGGFGGDDATRCSWLAASAPAAGATFYATSQGRDALVPQIEACPRGAPERNRAGCTVGNCDECEGGSPGTCKTCRGGYTRNGGRCTLPCDAANCEECYVGSTSACKVCEEGYSRAPDSGVCELACNDPQCASCADDGDTSTCELCKPGFAKGSDGTCEECSAANCLECQPEDATKCKKCQSELYENTNFECKFECSLGSCLQCDPNSLNSGIFQACGTCKQGFFAEGRECKTDSACAVSGCLECMAGDDEKCSVCNQAKGYALTIDSKCDGGKESECGVEDCAECAPDDKQRCDECQTGYDLVSGQTEDACQAKQTQLGPCSVRLPLENCEACFAFDIYSCAKCEGGYDLDDESGTCTKRDTGSGNSDPHLQGFHGQAYEFCGAGKPECKGLAFSLVSEARMQFNAEVDRLAGADAWPAAGTWMTGLGLRSGGGMAVELRLRKDVNYALTPDGNKTRAMRPEGAAAGAAGLRALLASAAVNGEDVLGRVGSGDTLTCGADGAVSFPATTHAADPTDGPVMVIITPDTAWTWYIESEDTCEDASYVRPCPPCTPPRHLDFRLELRPGNAITRMHGLLGTLQLTQRPAHPSPLRQSLYWAPGAPAAVEGGDDLLYAVAGGLLGTDTRFGLFGKTAPAPGARRTLMAAATPAAAAAAGLVAGSVV